MNKIIFLSSAIVLLTLINCSNDNRRVELTIIHDTNLECTERGALINKMKEGYWITISNDGTIEIESFYKNGKLNGPVKLYFSSGELMEKGNMKDDKESGTWFNYFDNGSLRSHGEYVNGKKTGIWEFLSLSGKLDRRVLYTKDTFSVLIDNHLSIPPPNVKQ